MSDIYVPLDFSDLKSKIPPGEDIIYSTLSKAFTSVSSATKTKTYKWISHILITPNGVAYTYPNTRKRKAPYLQIYKPWGEIDTIASGGRLGVVLSTSFGTTFKLIREENYETEEKFNERIKEFISKFRPLLVKKKEEWLELNQNNPEIKRRIKKRAKTSLIKMRDLERKRLKKEAKK